MAKTYAGVNNVARNISNIYVGVNGVARKVERAYVGVNGVARRIYPERVYLWRNATGDNYGMTGGWTGTYYHRTNSGTNYSMTRMTSQYYNGGYYLNNNFSSTDGTSEKAMYVRTVKAINFTPYKKLIATGWRNYSKKGNDTSAYFGAYNSTSSGTLYCQTNELTTKFLRYGTHPITAGTGSFTITVDVSTLTGSYIIVYDNFQSNMNNTISLEFSNIWLE